MPAREQVNSGGQIAARFEPSLFHVPMLPRARARTFLPCPLTVSDCVSGQRITPFILWMALMALDPIPFDLVGATQPQKFLPEIPIQYGLFLGIDPVASDPTGDPNGHPLHNIVRIGDDPDVAGPFQPFQCLDHGPHFHPVVGGVGVAPRDLLCLSTISQNRPVPSGAGIAATGAV